MGAWLAEAKKSAIENLAPVLTAIFTPLFALRLLVAAAVYAVSGIRRDFDRGLLVVFDALLLVVLARALRAERDDPLRRPGGTGLPVFGLGAAVVVLLVLPPAFAFA